MLNVNNIDVFYGAIHAIKNVSFQVKEGEIVTLIGANGAGKTSILHTVSGLIRAKKGEVLFQEQNIQHIEPHKLLTYGMAHVPEGRRVFAQMTVLENLELGAFTVKDKSAIEERIQHVFKKFPRLLERKKQLAGTLSGGEQQMLAMGRALVSNPKLLLLDEPSMGLAPILVKEIFNMIEEINKSGTTVLLVEQNANMALSIADRAYVLETGKVVMEGNARELMGNDEVRRAYLG